MTTLKWPRGSADHHDHPYSSILQPTIFDFSEGNVRWTTISSSGRFYRPVDNIIVFFDFIDSCELYLLTVAHTIWLHCSICYEIAKLAKFGCLNSHLLMTFTSRQWTWYIFVIHSPKMRNRKRFILIYRRISLKISGHGYHKTN